MLLRMVDSAYPPDDTEVDQLLAWHVDAIGGYIGGRSLNVWRREDFIVCDSWHFRLLPIWVGPASGITHADGAQEGNVCIQAMQAFGLAGAVALDIEAYSPVSTDWLNGFVDACRAGDLGVILYCTAEKAQYWGHVNSLVGVWVADWGSPYPGKLVPNTVAWQYGNAGRWDYSVLASDVALATLVNRQV